MNSIQTVQPNSEITKEMANMGPKYTPYVTLLSNRSSKINEPGNEHLQAMVNKFVLNKNKNITLIGESSFDFLLVATRMRASYWTEKESTVVYFGVEANGDAETYMSFRDKTLNRVKGYKYGSDHLIYIPDIDEIATLFLGNTKDRENAGQSICDMEQNGVREINIYRDWYNVKGVKYPRYILKARPATDITQASPDPEKLASEIHRFMNPPVFDSSDQDDNTSDGR